ncbi:MAG: efflux RND transporter permease subunit [Pseudomonadota bacterium]
MAGSALYRRPRLAMMLVLLAVVAGLAALDALPRREDPELTHRWAAARIALPGADAARVESAVIEPVEALLRRVSKIKTITARAQAGLAIFSLQLEDDVTAVEDVWAEVRSLLSEARARLPETTATPQLEIHTTAANALLIGLVWTQDTPPALDLLHRLARALERRVATLPDVEETTLYGEPEEEILVEADPARLADAGLGLDGMAKALARADARGGAGRFPGEAALVPVEIGQVFDNTEAVRRVVVRTGADGSALRVGDLAEVVRRPRSPPAAIALVDGRPAIVLAITMQTGARIDRWSRTTLAAIDDFAETLPEGVELRVLFRQSDHTEARFTTLTHNLALGIALVGAVLLAAMGWRAALLVALSLPLTLLTALALFQVAGVALHQVSITGLIIALGLLIDNAIVAVDTYHRMRRGGARPEQAIARTIAHLRLPLGASTLTTTLAFLPLVVAPGNAGEFVSSLGIGVILSVLCSLVLALTLLPALCGWLDRGGEANGAPRWRALSVPFSALLALALRRPAFGIAVSLVLPLSGFALAPSLVAQLFPPAERNQFFVRLALAPTAPIAQTDALVARLRTAIHAHEGVRGSVWFIGERPPRVFYNTSISEDRTPRFAAGYVDTVDAASTAALLPVLQREVRQAFPEAMVLTLPFGQGPAIEAPIELRVFGPDWEVLAEIGARLRLLLAETPGITYSEASVAGGGPGLVVNPDRGALAAAGLDHADLQERLRAALDGQLGGSVVEGPETLPVRVRLAAEARTDLANLSTGTLTSPEGTAETLGPPLAALAQLDLAPTRPTLTRLDGERVNIVTAYLEPYALPAPAFAAFEAHLAGNNFALPPGYRLETGGEREGSGEAQTNLLGVFAPLAILMLGVLVAAFSSLRLALIVGAVAVLSVGAGLAALWAFGHPLGLLAIVGCMGLVGIAVNDAIVVLAALRADPGARRGEVAASTAVVLAASRHVLATTLTTIGGLAPLILAGGLFWPPLAVAVAGGMIGATLLALFFVPACHRLAVSRGGEPS